MGALLMKNAARRSVRRLRTRLGDFVSLARVGWYDPVVYYVGDQKYMMHRRPSGEPCVLLLAVDEHDNDITDLLLCWLGPRGDWHGDRTTTFADIIPAYRLRPITLTLTCRDGTELTVLSSTPFPTLA